MTTGQVNPQVNPQVLNWYFNLIFIHSDEEKVCLSNTSLYRSKYFLYLFCYNPVGERRGWASSNNICEWKTLQDQNKQSPAKKKQTKKNSSKDLQHNYL